MVLVCSAIIGLFSPAVISSPKSRDRAEAVSHAKQIGLALFEFCDDYGCYPSQATALELQKFNADCTAKLGNASSNDFFRQLFTAGTLDRETPFFAKSRDSRRPDNVTSNFKLLEKGEVGFAYVVSHAACKVKDFPIVLTPLARGELKFDYESARKFFGGNKVVVLWADNSVTIETVNKDGRVILNGKSFFDPSQPYWHGIPPRVAWPE